MIVHLHPVTQEPPALMPPVSHTAYHPVTVYQPDAFTCICPKGRSGHRCEIQVSSILIPRPNPSTNSNLPYLSLVQPL